jgi:hypothetical protein
LNNTNVCRRSLIGSHVENDLINCLACISASFMYVIDFLNGSGNTEREEGPSNRETFGDFFDGSFFKSTLRNFNF